MSILLFGGTTEGRRLSELLSEGGMQVTLSVATEYGQRIMTPNENIRILTDRLDKTEMTELMRNGDYEYVIDATHPYAFAVTKNIQAACETVGVRYLRLIRPAAENSKGMEGVTYVADAETAADMLSKTDEKALLTIGSKELDPFTHINNFAERCFVRIIPMPESLHKAIALGFRNANIICMQGPFDKELNKAMLKMTGCRCMVTKDSGDTGGFDDKLSAALEMGCRVIVISRPCDEEGYTYDELLKLFKLRRPYRRLFPLFIDMSGKEVLVIGGGAVAERRVRALGRFGADITVIAPEASEGIEQMASYGEIRYIKKRFDAQDMTQKVFLAIAATDDRAVNHRVMETAEELGILAIISDRSDECGCYFPAIAESGEYIAGLVSKCGNHRGVKELAVKVRSLINDA